MEKKIKDSRNPYRICKVCGSSGNSYAVKTTYGLMYTAKCKTCINSEAKNKIFTTCQKCGEDKEETYNRYCNNCTNEYRWFIEPQDLITIKRWVRKQEIRNFMIDLEGLNELITIYQIVTHRVSEYDHLSSGNQLQKMWNKIFKVYTQIKDINDDILLKLKLDKIELKFKKKDIFMIKKSSNSDLDYYFKIVEEYEIDGKKYSLKQEYLDCVTGSSKISCARCRKIIQEMRRELIRLKNNTGTNYKNGKK